MIDGWIDGLMDGAERWKMKLVDVIASFWEGPIRSDPDLFNLGLIYLAREPGRHWIVGFFGGKKIIRPRRISR